VNKRKEHQKERALYAERTEKHLSYVMESRSQLGEDVDSLDVEHAKTFIARIFQTSNDDGYTTTFAWTDEKTLSDKQKMFIIRKVLKKVEFTKEAAELAIVKMEEKAKKQKRRKKNKNNETLMTR
jgi:hypothetical protein